jgi:hypothetical protein
VAAINNGPNDGDLDAGVAGPFRSLTPLDGWDIRVSFKNQPEERVCVIDRISKLFPHVRPLRRYPVFDRRWYLERNPDVLAARANPLQHFLDFGGLEGRDPHPLFSSSWYLARNPDVAARRMNPLVHYLTEGAAERREPHPLFDTTWYISQNTGALPYGVNPLQHYLNIGAAASRSPHPIFDPKTYLEDNPDVAKAGVDPMVHFLTIGWREGRNPHRLFQSAWYLSQNPHVARRGENPLIHYVTVGAFEGCNPNPVFDNDWYLEQNGDLRAAGIPALAHYIAIGTAEGRRPNADFDPAWYTEAHALKDGRLDEPLTHYLYEGRERQLQIRPIVARHPVAVVFLARSVDGSTAGLDRFAHSYRKFGAGLPHDLVVIRKGEARKPGARRAIELLFEEMNVQYIDVDDRGFDIQAYLKAAAILPHECVCFLNSHARITSQDWLRKLHAPLLNPGVGLAGATASFESITDTVDVNSKVVWLANRGELPVDAEMIELFRDQLEAHAPAWREATQLRLQNAGTGVGAPGLDIDREVEYARFWSSVTEPGAPLHGLENYRRFPNPHIRTNGFIVRRSLLLSLGFNIADSKIACNQFESGPGGLPDRLAERGLRCVLVGADGAAFDVSEWPQSGTFRLGDQHNVLIRDNRVDEFDAFTSSNRERLIQQAWGEYAGRVSESMKRLGFGFDRGDLGALPRIGSIGSVGSPVTISIVIPTHNRVSLVRDALSTIVGQSYRDWSCTVFDNASSEPLRDTVEAFGDSRIAYARSERFLPVTDSWNNAIDLARGDYVLLIGDDDGLTPHALESIADVLKSHNHPDVVYTALYQFFHPGVAPWEPSGYVSRLRYGFFFSDRMDAFRLDPSAARLAVAGSLEFRRNFTYNMQAFFFRRQFLETLRRTGGKIFQSPFPDYYLANMAMGLARDVVILPDPVSIAGVSRKSFGFTLFNNLPEKGDSLLAMDLADDRLYKRFSEYMLPGSSYDTKFALTMEHVADALGPTAPTKVNVRRYRRLQIFNSLGGVSGLTQSKPGAQPDFRNRLQPHLSAEEIGWAEELMRLGRRAASGSAQARTTLESGAKMVSMYAPAEQTVFAEERYKGDFASLPGLFAALKTGRAVW